MSNTHPKSRRTRRLRPTPALVVAFVALFAAMGGFGYAAVKIKPSSVKTKNIRNAAVTTDKIADGAVTTPKLAPDAVARPRPSDQCDAHERGQAAKLGGVAPGGCQTGWLKASLVVDTDVIPPDAAERPSFPASTAPATLRTRCRSRGRTSGGTWSPLPAMTPPMRS